VSPSQTPLETIIQSRLEQRAESAGAEPVHPPNLLTRAFLESVDYFDSFPSTAIPIAGTEDMYHPPATCYRLFGQIAGNSIDGHRAFTLAGECRRAESEVTAYRLPSFTMLEIVHVGGAEGVSKARDAAMQSELTLARDVGLDAELTPARDTFFADSTAGRGKTLMQKLLGLKFELTAPIAEGRVAISSFNLHREFFTSRLDITTDGTRSAWSACIAYGIERWARALTDRWGTDTKSWPDDLRAVLEGAPL
jgi:seryl-tRNA synthetase